MTAILITIIVVFIAAGLYFWLNKELRYNLPSMRFRKTVIDTYPAAVHFFRAGATDADLDRLVEKFPGPLPPTLLRMLSDTNGGDQVFFGMDLLSVDGIIREYDTWQIIVDGGLEDFTDPYCSFPVDTIQPHQVDKYWVPFAHDGAGNFIAIDFNPGPNGKMGQVISFGADQVEMLQLATDFPKFLRYMTDLVGHEQVNYDPDTGRYAFSHSIIDVVKDMRKQTAS